jgi:hypothetical protein
MKVDIFRPVLIIGLLIQTKISKCLRTKIVYKGLNDAKKLNGQGKGARTLITRSKYQNQKILSFKICLFSQFATLAN